MRECQKCRQVLCECSVRRLPIFKIIEEFEARRNEHVADAVRSLGEKPHNEDTLVNAVSDLNKAVVYERIILELRSI